MKKPRKIGVFITQAATDDTKQEKVTKVPLPSEEDIIAQREWSEELKL